MSDLVVVENIGGRLLLDLRKLHEKVHAAVLLSHELLVTRGVKDLSLQHDSENNDAVQELQGEVEPVEPEGAWLVEVV